MFFDHTVADAIARGALLSTFGLLWIILLVRVVGLRSFSKMTNFDFVTTVAMGSLLASAAATGSWSSMLQIVTAMTVLFGVQFCIALLRQRSDWFDSTLQNAPVLLMKDGKILHDALRQTRVTEGDLMGKLREANALELRNVQAVVLEATGDISVLHGAEMDQALIAGIAGARPSR